MTSFATGQVHVVERYPFVRTTAALWPDDPKAVTPVDTPTWAPGIDHEIVGPEGEADPVCDGFGKQVLTVVSVHKPGRFPRRVFYIRQWVDPDGKTFGRTNLKMATEGKFRRLARGYGADHHEPVRLRRKR